MCASFDFAELPSGDVTTSITLVADDVRDDKGRAVIASINVDDDAYDFELSAAVDERNVTEDVRFGISLREAGAEPLIELVATLDGETPDHGVEGSAGLAVFIDGDALVDGSVTGAARWDDGSTDDFEMSFTVTDDGSEKFYVEMRADGTSETDDGFEGSGALSTLARVDGEVEFSASLDGALATGGFADDGDAVASVTVAYDGDEVLHVAATATGSADGSVWQGPSVEGSLNLFVRVDDETDFDGTVAGSMAYGEKSDHDFDASFTVFNHGSEELHVATMMDLEINSGVEGSTGLVLRVDEKTFVDGSIAGALHWGKNSKHHDLDAFLNITKDGAEEFFMTHFLDVKNDVGVAMFGGLEVHLRGETEVDGTAEGSMAWGDDTDDVWEGSLNVTEKGQEEFFVRATIDGEAESGSEKAEGESSLLLKVKGETEMEYDVVGVLLWGDSTVHDFEAEMEVTEDEEEKFKVEASASTDDATGLSGALNLLVAVEGTTEFDWGLAGDFKDGGDDSVHDYEMTLSVERDKTEEFYAAWTVDASATDGVSGAASLVLRLEGETEFDRAISGEARWEDNSEHDVDWSATILNGGDEEYHAGMTADAKMDEGSNGDGSLDATFVLRVDGSNELDVVSNATMGWGEHSVYDWDGAVDVYESGTERLHVTMGANERVDDDNKNATASGVVKMRLDGEEELDALMSASASWADVYTANAYSSAERKSLPVGLWALRMYFQRTAPASPTLQKWCSSRRNRIGAGTSRNPEKRSSPRTFRATGRRTTGCPVMCRHTWPSKAKPKSTAARPERSSLETIRSTTLKRRWR